MSVLSVLVLKKMYELLIFWDKQNCPLCLGVRIKRVSVEWGSTVPVLVPLAACDQKSIILKRKCVGS